jgi:hypothetical protein
MILPSLLNTQHHLFVLNQEKIIHQINIMKVRLFHPRGCNIFASHPIMNFVTILLENLKYHVFGTDAPSLTFLLFLFNFNLHFNICL